MYPYLHLFGQHFPTYGFLGTFGVLLGLALAAFRCYLWGQNWGRCAVIYTCGGLGCLVGAQLLYYVTILPQIIRDLPLLRTDPSLFFSRYSGGGLVFYGGLMGAVAAAALAARLMKDRLSHYLSAMAPTLPLAHAFGRLGCFCAGCCYGTPADWGIAFPHPIGGAPHGVRLVPIQLFEAGAELLICAVLFWYTARFLSGTRALGIYFTLYAPVRFVLEFFRGDLIRGHLLWLSTSQWISIMILAAGLFLLLRKEPAPEPPAP